MLPTKQIQMITTNTHLSGSLPSLLASNICRVFTVLKLFLHQILELVRHHPVCGYRLPRQSLGEGAGCIPRWSKGGRGLRLSSASPPPHHRFALLGGNAANPSKPWGCLGTQYMLGMCVWLLPLQSSSLQPVIFFHIASQHFKEQNCG